MSKGSQPSGNTTVTQVNPTQQAQSPFLTQGWTAASNLYANNPLNYYPGQTLADFSPYVAGGYNEAATQAAPWLNQVGGQGVQAFSRGVNGAFGIGNSPAFAPLVAGGGNLATAFAALDPMARGDYLNSNPYLDRMFGSAANNITRAFEAATAPQTDSAMEAAGRYGSGALANARSQNAQDLGTTLDQLAANIYGGNYANERALQTTAAGQEGSLASNALNTLQGGYQAGNTQLLGALGLEPIVQQGVLAGPQAAIAAGQGLTAGAQAQINDAMQRYYGTQSAPWQTLAQYLSSLGQPTSGSLSTTTPYFTNPVANALGTGVGALGLYNGVNSLTGGALGSGIGGLLGLGGAGVGATALPAAALAAIPQGAVTAIPPALDALSAGLLAL